MSSMKAREGQWYADRSHHDLFCVIAVDESDGYIDVRDQYGDIDEFDLAEWEAMDLELCAAPEDWRLWSEGVDGEDQADADQDELPHRAPPSAEPSHQRKSSGTT